MSRVLGREVRREEGEAEEAGVRSRCEEVKGCGGGDCGGDCVEWRFCEKPMDGDLVAGSKKSWGSETVRREKEMWRRTPNLRYFSC